MSIPRIPQDDRLTAEPVVRQDTYQFLISTHKNMWLPDSVVPEKDLSDWNSLTDSERKFLETVLAFFAASDTIVNINITKNFLNDIKGIPEAEMVYRAQSFMEDIHSIVYARLITHLVKDEEKRSFLLNAVKTYPCVKKKADWAFKWIESSDSFAKRLLAFICVEGIFFSGSFCSIFWFHDRGIMKSLVQANEYISRDEALHCYFACHLYSLLNDKLTQQEAYDIVSDAVNIEVEFINVALECQLLGINSELMKQHIQSVADMWLLTIGYNKLYNVKNPLTFMEKIGLSNRPDFFSSASTITDYSDIEVKESEYKLESWLN